jgi:hypothetical protein
MEVGRNRCVILQLLNSSNSSLVEGKWIVA